MESDGFNALVLAAGLTWEQAEILRVYAKYLRQAGTTFSQDYIERVLLGNVRLARLLVRLFEARLDPRRSEEVRSELQEAMQEEILGALDDVASLDEDRILRAYLEMIKATLRTNYFQTVDGERKPYISLKFDSPSISVLPLPRPKFEVFVYSPRVEGVHLRFGKVARGGLRWSDRMEDFRTEVLGLVKAQMVKNTVIVPTGSKGGFVVKNPPKSGAREDVLAEGVACYRMFISGLLDLTDNLVDGQVVPPADVVRHDGDDTYLVVAADKGTATFSDIANDVAKKYGFWLGDAFASGGSIGYDHKGMGITARGAWESVTTSARPGWTSRPPTSRWSASATCPATCSATACCSPSTSGWSPPSTTGTSSSTPTRTPRAVTPNAPGCSRCRAARGPTTTPRSSPRAVASGRARPSRSR